MGRQPLEHRANAASTALENTLGYWLAFEREAPDNDNADFLTFEHNTALTNA